jgi:hypothetical protein
MPWGTPPDISFFVVKVKDWRQWHLLPKPQIGHLAPILRILTAVPNMATPLTVSLIVLRHTAVLVILVLRLWLVHTVCRSIAAE